MHPCCRLSNSRSIQAKTTEFSWRVHNTFSPQSLSYFDIIPCYFKKFKEFSIKQSQQNFVFSRVVQVSQNVSIQMSNTEEFFSAVFYATQVALTYQSVDNTHKGQKLKRKKKLHFKSLLFLKIEKQHFDNDGLPLVELVRSKDL